MMPHDQIRILAAHKLDRLTADSKPLFHTPRQQTLCLEAIDALADYAICRFVDRLRARGLPDVANLFDAFTLPEPPQPEEQES